MKATTHVIVELRNIAQRVLVILAQIICVLKVQQACGDYLNVELVSRYGTKLASVSLGKNWEVSKVSECQKCTGLRVFG